MRQKTVVGKSVFHDTVCSRSVLPAARSLSVLPGAGVPHVLEAHGGGGEVEEESEESDKVRRQSEMATCR